MKFFTSLFFFLLTLTGNSFAMSKDSYHEFSPMVSLFTGDTLRGAVNSAASYTYHLNRTYWVGLDFVGGKTNIDEPNGTSVKSGEKYLNLDAALYFNMPALLGAEKRKEEKGLTSDLYTSIGVGALWMGKKKEPFGFFGGGLILHTPLEWLLVRFDLKGLFYMLKNSDGTDFNSDLVLNIGPSFAF